MRLCQRAPGPPVHSVHPAMRVVSQAIPVILVCAVGYTTYVVADYVLMEQFYRARHQRGLALGLLVPYAVLAALTVACYFRTYFTIQLNPGTVPLGDESARQAFLNDSRAVAQRQRRRSGGLFHKGNKIGTLCDDRVLRDRNSNTRSSEGTAKTLLGTAGTDSTGGSGRSGGFEGSEGLASTMGGTTDTMVSSSMGPVPDLETGLAYAVPYRSNNKAAPTTGEPPRFTHTPGPGTTAFVHNNSNSARFDDPDSPGLELFYTKDVFACGPDGRPLWCSACAAWKPDRAHHCSEIGRCVRKMDHYCPWVGGIVAETAFKFFVQFVAYATLLWAVAIAACGCALQQGVTGGNGGQKARVIVALAVACMLGLFAGMMTGACARIVFWNEPTVEQRQLASGRPQQMAVRVARGAAARPGQYAVVTYPLAMGMMGSTKSAEAGGTDSSRDALACRTFAIVPVPAKMNVWDLGWRQNWVSVMGTNVVDWLLPLRPSPCCDHEATAAEAHSFYRLNPAFQQLCAELELPGCGEMEEVGRPR